ncbi:MAG: (E)-4-hydroxy-3-methylbut-2-enyl-diphosphate synthase [Bacteroidia bacterium]
MYCNSLTEYSRFKTRVVKIGDLELGGDNPIRVQSMTTTDTMDTKATVEQSIRMIEAGCELVRITAPSLKEAQNLENIKKEIRAAGFNTPLVADIHFTPNAAELAAKIVEKVRVNPGNYADKKKFESIDYTNSAYEAELERIRKRFSPLVEICKEHGTVMRIGTNHGSLSDRILSRYGDTPIGMVESAMEFIRICEDLNYRDIVISMKASNTQVMVQAYRLLVSKMIENNQNYPLHLGVTEAGDGEDGRIKSAVGIGTLLEDGLGDTIRVSLTEEPEFEIPVAKLLADRYAKKKIERSIPAISFDKLPYNPYEYHRSLSQESINIGGTNPPRIITSVNQVDLKPVHLFPYGYNYSVKLDKWNIFDTAVDYIYTGYTIPNFEIPGTLGIITNYDTWKKNQTVERNYPILDFKSIKGDTTFCSSLNFIKIKADEIFDAAVEKIKEIPNAVIILSTDSTSAMPTLRRAVIELKNNKLNNPIFFHLKYSNLNQEAFQLYSSTDFGSLLLDGFGDGIWIEQKNCVAPQVLNSTQFGILQATRTRISKTEYISCPSCGRTLFDLQETTQKIREKTNHLKGVKIGIMGCIVNGPGEMADADYGYVGTGIGKISLYKGQEVVKKNVASENAVNELINLIKEHGDWLEPNNSDE